VRRHTDFFKRSGFYESSDTKKSLMLTSIAFATAESSPGGEILPILISLAVVVLSITIVE